jgi:hypothetical protein
VLSQSHSMNASSKCEPHAGALSSLRENYEIDAEMRATSQGARLVVRGLR